MNHKNNESKLSKIKNKWWKILLIAFMGSLINTMLHGILPSDSSVFSPSIIVQQGLVPLAFLIYGFIYYVLLVCIFVIIQERLMGSKLVKGLAYGLFFCILTFIMYFEPLPSTATLSFTNMAWMLGDGIQFVILGLLLGLFLSNNSKNENRIKENSNKVFILIIPVIFLIGRLISYNIFHIYSNFQALPVNTLIWVFIFGMGIGITYYYILRPAIKTESLFSTAVSFGIIFGIFLFMFNYAYALIVSFTFEMSLDFFIRCGMDTLFATMGIFAFEYLLKTKSN